MTRRLIGVPSGCLLMVLLLLLSFLLLLVLWAARVVARACTIFVVSAFCVWVLLNAAPRENPSLDCLGKQGERRWFLACPLARQLLFRSEERLGFLGGRRKAHRCRVAGEDRVAVLPLGDHRGTDAAAVAAAAGAAAAVAAVAGTVAVAVVVAAAVAGGFVVGAVVAVVVVADADALGPEVSGFAARAFAATGN